jgi:hypothetical protein
MPSGAGAGGTAVLVLSTLQDDEPPPPPEEDELLVSPEPPFPPVLSLPPVPPFPPVLSLLLELLELPVLPAPEEVLSGPEEYEVQATGMTAMDAAATVASRIEGIVFISRSPLVYDDRLGSLFKLGRV